MAILFEPLANHHDRSEFSCGHPALDDWFRRRSGQDDRRNVARVFVAVDPTLRVIGFYSLSSFKIDVGELPGDIARKLPHYDGVPAALVGRLARDLRVRGQGVGELLVADAVRRLLSVSQTIAIFAIVVDAKDERAASFYESLSFQRFPTRPNRLFLLASSAGMALERRP